MMNSFTFYKCSFPCHLNTNDTVTIFLVDKHWKQLLVVVVVNGYILSTQNINKSLKYDVWHDKNNFVVVVSFDLIFNY